MTALHESLVLAIGDIHYGKRTTTYTPEIAKERMLRLGERLKRIPKRDRSYVYDELVIAILGDINDGSGIYPTQTHYQALTDVQKQAWEIGNFLAEWIGELAGNFPTVRVECVPGNHGRSGKYMAEAASWDLVAYQYLKLRLKDNPAISVGFNEEGDVFLRKVAVRGHHFLLYHGHDIRMYMNIPWYGMQNRAMRWAISSMAPLDGVVLGHFHTCGMWPVNSVKLIATGTSVTGDEWALRTLGMEPANQWWLWSVSDERPITWSMAMDV